MPPKETVRKTLCLCSPLERAEDAIPCGRATEIQVKRWRGREGGWGKGDKSSFRCHILKLYPRRTSHVTLCSTSDYYCFFFPLDTFSLSIWSSSGSPAPQHDMHKCQLTTIGGDLLTERIGPLKQLHIVLTERALWPLKCAFSHGSQRLSSFMSSVPIKETINIYIVLSVQRDPSAPATG